MPDPTLLERGHDLLAPGRRWHAAEAKLQAESGIGGRGGSRDRTDPIPWPSAAPVGAISDVAGVDVGGVVHLAGRLAWNPDGSVMGGTAAEQLSGCYAAIDRTLSSAGLPRAALVAEHDFVVARGDEALDFVAIRDAHRAATAGHKPASTLVPVSSLAVPGALTCVAAVVDGTPG